MLQPSPAILGSFTWASVSLIALLSALGREGIQASFLARPLDLSTECSGIGCAEVATAMLVAASRTLFQQLGFVIRVSSCAACVAELSFAGVRARLVPV